MDTNYMIKVNISDNMKLIHFSNNKKNTLWSLGIIRHNGYLCWETRAKDTDGNGKHIITGVNPIPGWLYRIKWNMKYLYLVVTRQKHKQCQGCGEGYVKYEITDPNELADSDTKLLCCEGCVNFYDWHGTSKKLDLTHRVL